MGILATVKQRDHETLASRKLDPGDVFPQLAEVIPDDTYVRIRLREYELYERIFVFRGTAQKQKVVMDLKYEDQGPYTGKILCSKAYAWRAEDGPGSGWQFTVRSLWDSVRHQIKEKYGDVSDFEEAVAEVVDDG